MSENTSTVALAASPKKAVHFPANTVHKADQQAAVGKVANHHGPRHPTRDEATSPPLAGAGTTRDSQYGGCADEEEKVPQMEHLSALLLKMDKADRRLFTSSTVNPLAVSEEIRRQCGLEAPEDWSTAAWGRIPALDNLKHLSILSRFDIEAPIDTNNSPDAASHQLQLLSGPPQQSTGTTPPDETPSTTDGGGGAGVVTVPRDPTAPSVHTTTVAPRVSIIPYVPSEQSKKPHMREPDQFVLSDIGRCIPAAENIKINIALDIRLVKDVQELVSKSAVRDDNISTTTLRMKHLLGLGRSQQTMGTNPHPSTNVSDETVNEWIRDVCYRVALANPSCGGAAAPPPLAPSEGEDEVDRERQRIINILLQSNLKFLPVSSAVSRSRRPESSGSREQRDLLRDRQPSDHNRGFYSSDVASYPAIRPIYSDQESIATLNSGPPVPALSIRERRDKEDDHLPTIGMREGGHTSSTALTVRPPSGQQRQGGGGSSVSRNGRRHVVPKAPRFNNPALSGAGEAGECSSSSSDEDGHVTRSIFTSSETIAATVERRRRAQQFPSMHQYRIPAAEGEELGSPGRRPQGLKSWMEKRLEVAPSYEGEEANETKELLVDTMAQYAAVLERADLAAAGNRVQVLQHEVNAQRNAIAQEEAEIRALEERSTRRRVYNGTSSGIGVVTPSPPRALITTTASKNDTTPSNNNVGRNLFALAEVAGSLTGASLFSQMALMSSSNPESGGGGITDLDRAERQLVLEQSLLAKHNTSEWSPAKAASTPHSPIRPVGTRRPISHTGPRAVQPTTTKVELPIKPAADDDDVDPHLPHCDQDKNTDVDRPEYAPFMDHYLSRQSTLRRHYSTTKMQVAPAAAPQELIE